MSDQDIDDIESMLDSFPLHVDIGEGGIHNAVIRPFFPYRESYQRISDILLPRITELFGDVNIDTAHILESRTPYGIHNDVASAGFDPLQTDRLAAWTFIIPLDDYPSHTIVFNESDPVCKTVQEWQLARSVAPHGIPIDVEFHSRYLSHVDIHDLDFLTVASIFAWKKGSLFAAARKNFHTSDNFPANGLTSKRAIIMWTTVPGS